MAGKRDAALGFIFITLLLDVIKNESKEIKKADPPVVLVKTEQKDTVKEFKVIYAVENTPVYPKKTVYEKGKKIAVDSLKVDKGVPVVTTETENSDIIFKVKIGSSKDLKVLKTPLYQNLTNVKGEKMTNGSYILYYGQTSIYKEVVELQTEARNKGFKEAFAVAFNNGKRIAINDALSLLKKK